MADDPIPLRPKVARLCTELSLLHPEIPEARKSTLHQLADYVQARRAKQEASRVNFICTHNSRRSHLAQLWLGIAADYYGIPDVQTFSGGTEATALSPQAVAALQRAGLKIVGRTAWEKNPLYHVNWRDSGPPTALFSKIYDEAPNPKRDFAAVLVCESAAEDCPFVPGANPRIVLPYEDPKWSDGTPEEEEAYDETLQEIGRDMLYVMARVADSER